MWYPQIKKIACVLLLFYIIDWTHALKSIHFNRTTSRLKRQSTCEHNEFRCKSGECINKLYLCDGQTHCPDKSDEVFEECRAILCPETSFTFRCNYGACISSSLRCNGVKDCLDGSDEQDCSVPEGCILPEHVQYGRYEISSGSTYIPNKLVPSSTTILLLCENNDGKNYQLFYCLKNQWRPSTNTAKCRKPGTCTSIKTSSSEEVFCKLNDLPVSCEEPVSNTTATVRCQPFYTFDGYRPIYKCQNGQWDQPFTPCHPECGVKTIGATELIIEGGEAIKNEYPWAAGIYNSSNHHICGGTVISRYFVLSAAHCFTFKDGKPKNKEDYTIVTGKHHSDMNINEKSAQIRKIKSLYVHEDYRGRHQKYRDDIALLELEKALALAFEVQPICVDWENNWEDFDFIDGNEGVVVGWGYTQATGLPSDVLKKLVVPYRSRNVCLKELPIDFREQYYTSDKFCGGYKDKMKNVCSGDSGGGLYFKSDSKKYFIRGIVSIAVKSEIGCDANTYALYTRVSRYLSWLEAKTRRIL